MMTRELPINSRCRYPLIQQELDPQELPEAFDSERESVNEFDAPMTAHLSERQQWLLHGMLYA